MKKFLSTILTCLLLVSVVSTGVSAESIEELEVSSIVQGYLQAQADAKYLAKRELSSSANSVSSTISVRVY